MCNAPSNPATLDFVPPNLPWPVTDARERPEIFAQPPGDHIRWRRLQPESCNPSQTCHQHKLRNLHLDVSRTASTFNFSFACGVCPSSGQTDSFAPKQPFRISFQHVPRSRLRHRTHLRALVPHQLKVYSNHLLKNHINCASLRTKRISPGKAPQFMFHTTISRANVRQMFYSFFFIGDLSWLDEKFDIENLLCEKQFMSQLQFQLLPCTFDRSRSTNPAEDSQQAMFLRFVNRRTALHPYNLIEPYMDVKMASCFATHRCKCICIYIYIRENITEYDVFERFLTSNQKKMQKKKWQNRHARSLRAHVRFHAVMGPL